MEKEYNFIFMNDNETIEQRLTALELEMHSIRQKMAGETELLDDVISDINILFADIRRVIAFLEEFKETMK